MPPRRKGLFATVFGDRLRGLAPTVVIAQVLTVAVVAGFVLQWPERGGWYSGIVEFLDDLFSNSKVEALGFACRLPWLLSRFGALLWPLSLPVALWIVLRGRTAGGRALAAAIALAAAVTSAVVGFALAGRSVPAGALATFDLSQALVALALAAAGIGILLLPLRRVTGGAAPGPVEFASLIGYAVLTSQVWIFTSLPGTWLAELLRPDGLPDLRGRYSGLMLEAGAASVWPPTLASFALALVPGIVVLRGRSLAGALRDLGRALRRRPLGVVAATWHAAFLGALAFVLLAVTANLNQMEEDRAAAEYKVIFYSAVLGLVLGVWVWLMGRFALALTDPGYLGRATQAISSPPSERGVPSKSP